MPLPFIIGAIAVAAGATGVAKGVSGASKIKKAKEEAELIESMYEDDKERLGDQEESTQRTMDSLGKKELDIMASFKVFSDTIEKIHNRPKFKYEGIGGNDIAQIDIKRLKDVSIGAEALKATVAGSALGVAGACAASGATASAVSMFGVASTGTAISGLSGAAATNATLAALGGGSLAAGGGGIALGSAVLSGATLGIGLMVGGFAISHVGNKAKENVNKAWDEYWKAEELINEAISILEKIENAATDYIEVLTDISEEYFNLLNWTVNLVNERCSWDTYSIDEQNKIEKLVLLVAILFKMCSVKFILQENNKNTLNKDAINKVYKFIEDNPIA